MIELNQTETDRKEVAMKDILCIGCEEVHSNEYPRHPIEVRAHARKVEAINKRKGEAIRNQTEVIRRRVNATYGM